MLINYIFYDRPDFSDIILIACNLILVKILFFYFKKRSEFISVILIYAYIIFCGMF